MTAFFGKPVDFSFWSSLDTETPRFRPGEMAPRIVCGSTAWLADGEVKGELLYPDQTTNLFAGLLEKGHTITFANAAYDLCVLAQRNPSLLALIFRAIREGKIYDILLAQALDAIYHGHLGLNPNFSELRKPSTGEVTNRYSLEVVVHLLTGRADAKDADDWRTSYALLEDVPFSSWPARAKKYPIDDAINTLDATIRQVRGRVGDHEWLTVPSLSGSGDVVTICRHCARELTFSWPTAGDRCDKAPLMPHQNLDDLPAQVDYDFCAKLGAAHSFRTDPEKVEKLAAEVEAKHKVAVERFQKKGWIREDGTEDQAAVKRAIAVAYGATGTCTRCRGVGRLRPTKLVSCRGEKIKGRYRGCEPSTCDVCHGSGQIEQLGNEITCKNVYDEDARVVEEGCDGTGFDLSTAPMLPRTDKLGVKTDRDATMESGDDEIAAYGDNEFAKSLSTYVPYLRKGTSAPLYYSPNALVATGRGSIENSPLHQMPRNGGERECIRARGAWCDYPEEMVLSSTDYEAGELVTLAQLTYWLFGFSQMRDAINKSGKPGILHSDLAAEVLGIPLDEFLKRLKEKDKQAGNFRQAMKPISFGKPGRMGTAKLVLSARKKNNGFTVCEGGPAVNEKGEPGYWGIRFCVLTGGAKQCGVRKVMEWKKYPCAPVCEECLKIVDGVLTPAYFRRYPEIRRYFDWAQRMFENKQPAPTAIWDANEGAPKIVRERAVDEITTFCNNGFQSLLAQIGKRAFCDVTRECYLGVKPDGLPSPLAGCRAPIFLHDEPLGELILETAHLSGPRIAEIMVEAGYRYAPDVTWKAETALAFFWNKSMESVYRDEMADGKLVKKLVPWGNVPDYLKEKLAA